MFKIGSLVKRNARHSWEHHKDEIFEDEQWYAHLMEKGLVLDVEENRGIKFYKVYWFNQRRIKTEDMNTVINFDQY